MSGTSELGLDFLDDGEESNDSEVSAELTQAEANLRKAQCYRDLMSCSFFENGDAVSQSVDAEMRAFAKHRMAVLLGVTKPPMVEAPASFSPEHVKVLSSIAARILENPAILANVLGSGGQTRKRTVAPRPVPATPRAVGRRAPQEEQTQQEPRLVTRPAAPAPPPAVPAKAVIPADESVITRDGRTFKVRWREIESQDDIPPGMEGFKKGSQWYKLVYQDITPSPKPDGIPMPSPTAVAALSMMKSAESFAMQGGRVGSLAFRLGAVS
jgi:hypothetical protein